MVISFRSVRPGPTAIGARIREARLHAGLGQSTLGGLVGRSQAAISSWERGHREPSWQDLRSLGAVLGRPLAYFVAEGPIGARPWRDGQAAASPVDRLARIEAELASLRDELSRSEGLLGAQVPVQPPTLGPFRAWIVLALHDQREERPFPATVLAIGERCLLGDDRGNVMSVPANLIDLIVPCDASLVALVRQKVATIPGTPCTTVKAAA